MSRIFAFVLALVLAGCASSGTDVSQQQIDQFKVGVTTYDQMVAALGEPNSVTVLPDGSRIVVYSYAKISTRPETYIPVVGLFAGGADVKSRTVAFTFGADGKLTRYTTQSTNASGTTTPP